MSSRRAVAAVNLAAVERNCARLAQALVGGAQLCAVVKADGYGHGANAVAGAALAGGASWLAVATAEEALALRDAGISAPLIVLGPLEAEDLVTALRARADVVAWGSAFVRALATLRPVHARVHVKLDTGMGRLGTRDVDEALAVADQVAAADGLELVGAMTHMATADDTADGFFDEQLARFDAFVQRLRARHPAVLAHAANSAATLRSAGSHYDMVRCGIAIYGLDPFHADPVRQQLEPALELSSYVAEVKRCDVGQSVGYGRRFRAARATSIALLPLGYADGVRRALENNAEVLIAGRRHPLVGAVSMDSVTVDVGEPTTVTGGERALLIGAQGEARILAEEVARWAGTINYEIACGIGSRVVRRYHRDGELA